MWKQGSLRSVETDNPWSVQTCHNGTLQEYHKEQNDSTYCAAHGPENQCCNLSIGKKMLCHSSHHSSQEHPARALYKKVLHSTM